MRKFLTSVLLCALLLGLCTPALAFSDLSEDNWAYPIMTQAAEKGILTGGDNGYMYPTGSLSWGQCLIMLGRAFYPPTLAKYPFVDGVHWAKPAYDAAMEQGVLTATDFLPVSPAGLDAPITRQDTAELVNRVLLRVFDAQPAELDPSIVFSDFSTLPEPYRSGALQCASLGIINGKDDGCFAGGDPLSRAEGSAILVRALALVEESPDDDVQVPDQPGDVVAPPANNVVVNGPLRSLGDNSEKRVRLFGTDSVKRYSSEEEADAHTATVTVPVWRLNKSTGVKTSSEISFQVNAALADDMVSIFTEIYNDPEQFPIYSIGGYDWRSGATGEHNCGTALDINYIENYQIYPDGRVGAGECWLPGENPFSIPEAGSVVRIFNKYGYSWGGNAWPSYSNKDYMHFSYLGL